MPVRLPRESAWSEKRAKPEPLPTAGPTKWKRSQEGPSEREKEKQVPGWGGGEGVAVYRMGSARQNLMPS